MVQKRADVLRGRLISLMIAIAVATMPLHAFCQDARAPENSCDLAVTRAASLGLVNAEDQIDEGNLKFRWRLTEMDITFPTDEFDKAQGTISTTSLLTGQGTYIVNESLQSNAGTDAFSYSTSGGIKVVEGCNPDRGQQSFSCKFTGDGRPGCFRTTFHLPAINRQSAASNDRKSYSLTWLASSSGLVDVGAKTRLVFRVPGDYSKATESAGGHRLDQISDTLTVASNFVFDREAGLTTLALANDKVADSVADERASITLFGAKVRQISKQELRTSLYEVGRVVLHINFDFDKSTLRPDAIAPIQQVVALLREVPELSLTIEGYTDGLGTAAHNKALSEARALAVKNAIVADGIDGGRLLTKGFGSTPSIAENSTEEGRFKNRRVELVRR